MKVLPLRLEGQAVEQFDETWRSRGIKSRTEFLRRALAPGKVSEDLDAASGQLTHLDPLTPTPRKGLHGCQRIWTSYHLTARFRLVHHILAPFAGSDVTLGALVEGNGRFEFARARWLPGARCASGMITYFSI